MDARSFAESVTTPASETRHVERRRQRPLPMLLTIDETADLLRTTRRAVYAMVERRQLPGVVRVRRRVLVRSQELLDWLDQKSALSLKENKR
ncbi:MAG TPA: helix-turn-helix domain-containing protein [Gemmatimonadaceae bacterium]|jgi:excisionase family DNA binding protein